MASVPPDVDKSQAALDDGSTRNQSIEQSGKISEKQQDLDIEAGLESKQGQIISASSPPSADNLHETGYKKNWYHKLNPLRWQKTPPLPETRQENREKKAGFLSVITFQWVAPLMTTGYLRTLEIQDIWLVHPDRELTVLSATLQANFKRYQEKGGQYPLLWSLLQTFKWDFIIGGCCQFVSAMLQVFTPYTTRYLISFATEAWISKHFNTPQPHIGRGIGLVIGISVMQLTQSLTMNQFFYRGMIVGGQARAVLIDTIFVKTTKISSRARAGGKALTGESSSASQEQEDGEQSIEQIREARDKLQQSRKSSVKAPEEKDKADGVSGDGTGWSNGRIITLMSIDTDRIDKAFGLFHIVWTSPLILIVALIMLLVNIGYSCLAGYALLIISLPLLSIAVKSLFRRRMKINKVTDQRVSLTQEILQAVRFVKYFSWESSFLNRLKELRAEEIRKIQVVQSIRNGLMCVALALPVFASMISFITYALSKHDLEAAAIFSSLAMFNTIRTPLNMLPLTISQLTDAIAALKRIQAFLLAEEREETITQDPSMENTVEVEDATFTWERVPTDNESEEQKKKKAKKDRKSLAKSSSPPPETAPTDPEAPPFKLENLSLTIHPNELLAIIGPVGCGKTSLLSALAGDMRLTTGTARMNASRAYCPQYAWIQNATIKQNILFGKPYDAEKYNAVIEACALKADIAMFTDGDETEIGERGITLSGGQKQRLNIARAMYFDAGVVLLDDPLSAVDAHVGRHIMDNAICGLLRNKCVVLATHQLHVLSRCDRIVLMDKGKIETIGTFEELMEGSEAFRRLMSTTAQEAGDQGEKNKADDGNDEETGDEDGIDSADDSDNNDDKPKGHTKSSPLMQQEDRGTNSVSWRIWAAYIRSFGRFPFLLNVPLIIFTLISANGANIITGLWLSWWTSNNFSLSQGQYMGLYAGLAAAQCLLMFTLSTTISLSTTNASRKMYAQAMERVLRAPMGFFDTTPLGRITNRFSKDIATMDNELTDTVRMAFLTVSMIISIIILIIVVFHWFALALVPLLILFTLATLFYRRSAQELKRHESVLRSTVFAQFSESLSGIPSIRAYNMQSHFTSRLRTSLDDMDSAYFLTFANQRWLSVRIDAVGNLMVFVTGILVVTSRFNVSPSTSGLVLSYILSIVSMLQFTVREVAELENNMNATERVYGYATALETEGEMFGVEVDREWPAQGRITFEDVQMRYRPGLPLVLKGLSMDVKGGEKIGIVGRTGAGKSSIMSALFRLSELSGGKISIDGVDISKVGLHDLRSRLAIIPQDPTLFRGTIRSNLDPFGEHTDLELWHSLRKAGLVDDQLSPSTSSSSENAGHTANNSPQSKLHLDSPVEEDGLNYSLGQRQLLALARALVRDSRIIICDEATSSVDFDTDARIQRTIAQGFTGKTLLCIAHRLRTIIGYDRICVVDKGEIVEMDAPVRLWEREGGVFRGMCERSGIGRGDF